MLFSKTQIFNLSLPTNIHNLLMKYQSCFPSCSSNTVYTYMHAEYESAVNPCMDGEKEGTERGKGLEALTSSSLTRFLAKGTKEVVKVKQGSTTTRAIVQHHLSFGCGRWRGERRKLHLAPSQPIIVGYPLMDKHCPLSSENAHPVSTNPQSINSTFNVEEHMKDIYWNEDLSPCWHRMFWSCRQWEKTADVLQHEKDTSPKTCQLQ